MTNIDVLKKAKKIIEQGWTQGSFVSLNGDCCLLGAVHKAKNGWVNDWVTDIIIYPSLLEKLYRALPIKYKRKIDGICKGDKWRKKLSKSDRYHVIFNQLTKFNDSLSTTIRKILNLLDRAINE